MAEFLYTNDNGSQDEIKWIKNKNFPTFSGRINCSKLLKG